MKKIIILLAVAAIAASCSTSQHLHQSGIYTIKEREGNVTEFFEVQGKYTVISDTLKKFDKVVINVIKMHPFKKTDKKADVANTF